MLTIKEKEKICNKAMHKKKKVGIDIIDGINLTGYIDKVLKENVLLEESAIFEDIISLPYKEIENIKFL